MLTPERVTELLEYYGGDLTSLARRAGISVRDARLVLLSPFAPDAARAAIASALDDVLTELGVVPGAAPGGSGSLPTPSPPTGDGS